MKNPQEIFVTNNPVSIGGFEHPAGTRFVVEILENIGTQSDIRKKKSADTVYLSVIKDGRIHTLLRNASEARQNN